MNNKVLLTGASGFLGLHFFEFLTSHSFKLTTLGLGQNNTISCDISKPIPSLDTQFQIVIHSAGKAHITPKNQLEKQQFFDVNYTGTKNLCKALEKNLPNTFVFISTIAVYGIDEGSEINEFESLKGETPYAKSKIMAENHLQDWAKEKSVNLVILRLPLVAGKNPKGNLGAMIKGIIKGYYFNISRNYSKKSIVLADDIAKLIPGLVGKNGIYNLAGDKDYTFKEISNIIADQLGIKKVNSLPHSIVSILAKIGDFISIFPINSLKLKKITSTLTISSEKAKKELNWKPKLLRYNFRVD